MKRCPIAGSIGILPCCVLNDFFTQVWTLTWFVRPLLATILCVWEIWSGSNNRVYMYHVFHSLATKILQKNARHRTDFEADLWPETVFGRYHLFLVDVLLLGCLGLLGRDTTCLSGSLKRKDKMDAAKLQRYINVMSIEQKQRYGLPPAKNKKNSRYLYS